MPLVIAGIAAIAGGAINALAGGGTLITFPVLTALGLPAVVANVTNTVALCPGYFGAAWSQRSDLAGKAGELWIYIPLSLAGGILGGYLLLQSGEELFSELVPILILAASLLLAIQGPLNRRLLKRKVKEDKGIRAKINTAVLLFPAAIYGGYFGAGISVIILAVLGIFSRESLTKLNSIKQAIAFSVNIAAAVYFIFSSNVNWSFAAVMAAGALAGGFLGGRLAGAIKQETLRRIVVIIGVAVALAYWLA
ncbi:MAG TPA: sulfite exporter TauE/SafE family protein [Cyclobacteriaceae bacterium]|nr:sulfite exporter TauE/SafE family protein [Cyclobacteriaceae bacterium]